MFFYPTMAVGSHFAKNSHFGQIFLKNAERSKLLLLPPPNKKLFMQNHPSIFAQAIICCIAKI